MRAFIFRKMGAEMTGTPPSLTQSDCFGRQPLMLDDLISIMDLWQEGVNFRPLRCLTFASDSVTFRPTVWIHLL